MILSTSPGLIDKVSRTPLHAGHSHCSRYLGINLEVQDPGATFLCIITFAESEALSCHISMQKDRI